MSVTGVGYLLGIVAGLAAALGAGGGGAGGRHPPLRQAPRLVLTVATIGLSQLLAAAPAPARPVGRPAGGHAHRRPVDSTHGRPDHPVGQRPDRPGRGAGGHGRLALFLLRTRAGTAIRASAERADRAATLGIPVQRLHVLVWALAAALAFVALFLRAGILGVPVGSALTLGVLLGRWPPSCSGA